MTMRFRAILALIVAVAMMGLASCGHYVCGATFGSSTCTPSGSGLGGGGGNGSGTVFAYLLAQTVNNGTGMTADILDLSTPLFQEAPGFVAPTLPLTLPSDGGTVVVNKGGQKYLYIPFDDGTLYGYSIDGTTGALTTVVTALSVTGGTSIASDPAGNFLFVGDSATGDISTFSIATNGSLTALGSPVASGISVAQMTTDGLGRFLYATAGAGGTQIAGFTITAGVGLVPLSSGLFTFSVSKVLGENTGNFLLGIDGQTANIFVFSVASTGAITQLSSSGTVAIPIGLVVHPSGKFVYTFTGLSTPMEGYLISAGGTLTAVNTSPFAGVNLDEGEFDQSGLFLFGVAEGPVAIDFAPYDTDTSTGDITVSTFGTLGFPGRGFAVTDLNNAP